MDNHKFSKKSDRYLCWVAGPFLMLFMLCMSLSMLIIIFFTDISSKPMFEYYITESIIIIIMLGVLPMILFSWMVTLFWRIVEISEDGVKSSFLKCFLKREITWDEMHDICIKRIPAGGAWLFFSTKNLDGMSIGKARRQKGQIQIELSEKVIESIKKYSGRSYENLKW